jgi:peptide chain release factor 1
MIDHNYLEQLQARLSEQETRMSQPEVSADPKKMQECMREYAHTKKRAECAKDYLDLLARKNEGESILADADTDAELREMAEMEIAEAEEKLPQAEREMMVALIPPDPTDSRNVIMEIRAGTGGDEAGIFCGDLYRMYTRYFDTKGWKHDVMDLSSSEAARRTCVSIPTAPRGPAASMSTPPTPPSASPTFQAASWCSARMSAPSTKTRPRP